MNKFFSVFLLLFLFSTLGSAAPKYYGNLVADLPPDWLCQKEGDDFVCLSNIEGEKKSSAIVISARQKGVEDSLTFFREQLKRPKTLEFNGLPVLSQVKEVRDLNINGQIWIEGIHIGSELQGYFTHYLVTTDNTNSALVSINIHQDEYNRIIPTLSGFVNSLQLVRNTNTPADVVHLNAKKSNVKIVSKNTITVMGYTIKRIYAFMAVAIFVLLILLGYAAFTD